MVIPEVDRGKVLLQKTVPIFETDTLADLQQRIHNEEHTLLVNSIKHFFNLE